MDENETKSSIDLQSENVPMQPNIENVPVSNENDNWTSVKSEPVCIFVNRNFDSSDSEQPSAIDEGANKPYVYSSSFFLFSLSFVYFHLVFSILNQPQIVVLKSVQYVVKKIFLDFLIILLSHIILIVKKV